MFFIYSRGNWDGHYAAPRRDEGYYTTAPIPRGSASTIGAPPAPAIGGLSPYQGSSSSSTVGGRIAPPLSSAEQWRRSDPKRNFYPNVPQSADGRPKNTNNVSRRPEYDKY